MSGGLKISKVGCNTSLPWMIVHISELSTLLEDSSLRVLEYNILLVTKDKIIWGREWFTISTSCNLSFASIASGYVATNKTHPKGSFYQGTTLIK